jgi:hypothetical protein
MLMRWRRRVDGRDEWNGWPAEAYRSESYRQRLGEVQAHITECLDLAPPGRVRLVSMCAGDGRDVVGVLRGHPRREDVHALLVESDAESVARGAAASVEAGLGRQVRFEVGDATDFSTYVGHVPCDLMLVCGVWGHVPPDQRPRLVAGLGSLVAPGGAVVWTRGVSGGRMRFDEIEQHFAPQEWELARLTMTRDQQWAVATHRHVGAPQRGRMFTFVANAG